MILNSIDPLSLALRNRGVDRLEALLEYVRTLPYRRISDGEDLSLVLSESCGTCSSKHAFVTMIAERNGLEDVHLMLSLYRMNGRNTPAVKGVLDTYRLDYIPEAHCFLRIKNCDTDLTGLRNTLPPLESEIISEHRIKASEAGSLKKEFHRKQLESWISEAGIPYSLEEIWHIRELCISELQKAAQGT